MQLLHDEGNSKIINQVNLIDKYAHEVYFLNNKKHHVCLQCYG